LAVFTSLLRFARGTTIESASSSTTTPGALFGVVYDTAPIVTGTASTIDRFNARTIQGTTSGSTTATCIIPTIATITISTTTNTASGTTFSLSSASSGDEKETIGPIGTAVG
jgi:hypothetical protein